MAVILPFAPTDYTLKRKIERSCQEHEKEMMKRAGWMYEFVDQFRDEGGCVTEEDHKNFEDGSYEQ